MNRDDEDPRVGEDLEDLNRVGEDLEDLNRDDEDPRVGGDLEDLNRDDEDPRDGEDLEDLNRDEDLDDENPEGFRSRACPWACELVVMVARVSTKDGVEEDASGLGTKDSNLIEPSGNTSRRAPPCLDIAAKMRCPSGRHRSGSVAIVLFRSSGSTGERTVPETLHMSNTLFQDALRY